MVLPLSQWNVPDSNRVSPGYEPGAFPIRLTFLSSGTVGTGSLHCSGRFIFYDLQSSGKVTVLF